jgi:hypothetical protein
MWEDLYMDELAQFGQHTSGTVDDFGIEGGVEGYDDYDQEDLMRYTAGRPFKDENMDLHFQQDFTNYPDGN